ncbi:uncharacterized protein BROUX77_001488 [Berkeleyomyces rouxiae]|uniref:uncharacterized protein n=1 Tax=Berkeleyomyces rouxiae TaxID=2035830 RepID=UPI003B7F2217
MFHSIGPQWGPKLSPSQIVELVASKIKTSQAGVQQKAFDELCHIYYQPINHRIEGSAGVANQPTPTILHAQTTSALSLNS